MSHRSIFRLSLLSFCLSTAFGAAQAQSQATPPGEKPQERPKTLDTVVVNGQAANLRGALDAQQAAQGIVSVVHADGIGQLPDNNAAEALARVPGVSVERDQGEGRFVRIRGLGPDLNGVSINGSVVPASEADRRAVGLDVVPAGLIRSLEVSKTLTPEQDANSLGGHIAVQTLSAFDQPGRFLSLEVGINHDQNANKSKPRAALTFADRFLDGKLGVALALSHDERTFGSDNVETGGAWDVDGGTAKLEELERRKYSITRQRQGAALNLDFRPDNGQRYSLRMFSSRFSDNEQRQAQGVEFADAQATGETGEAEVSRSLKARIETARISALTLAGERRFGDWLLSASLGASQASESTPDGLAGAAFVGDFDGVGFSGTKKPLLNGPASLADASSYKLDKIEIENAEARDRERNARIDLQHEGQLAGMELTLKFGAKTSRRTKTNEQETWVFKAKDLSKAPLSLSSAQMAMSQFLSGSAVDYPWGTFGPALSSSGLRALVAPLNRAKFREEEDSLVNDFRMVEQVDAAYLQAKLELSAKTQLLTGVRLERLGFEALGTGVLDGNFESVKVKTRSSHWLPSLLLRHDLGQGTLVRAALTSSLVRPSFGQVAPGFVIDGEEAEFGNPNLKPLRSRNLDLGIERRLARDGALSAYVFHKRIRDFVYGTDLAGSGVDGGRWKDFDSALTYANGETAKLSGLEFSYNQALRMLPSPWNGLIVGANATFVNSKAQVSGYKDGVLQSRQLALPSQSDRTVNLSLGWERKGFGARLALNNKSAYLLEVGDVLDASKDQWVDAQTQVDFSAHYDITPKISVSFEALNLNNSAYYVYAGRRALNSQYEQYGRSFKIGLKLAVF